MSSLTPILGDVFRFNEALYVYLAQTESSILTAKILDPKLTLQLVNIDDQKARMPSTATRTAGHKAYAYVILSTEQFIKQAAHLGHPSLPTDKFLDFDWIGVAINEPDKESLKTLILQEGSPVEKGLKKVFQIANT